MSQNLRVLADDLQFVPIPLVFSSERYRDVYAEKNNKTVGQTLEHHRYAKFESVVRERYTWALDLPLGRFLFGLKQHGDPFYQRFLNKYGDLEFSVFSILNATHHGLKGVYAYYGGHDLKYVGRCLDAMKKRINQGYGKVHPKNCYIDGQATNCHLNARITASSEEITLWLHPMTDDAEVMLLEQQLIRHCEPPWNIQR